MKLFLTMSERTYTSKRRQNNASNQTSYDFAREEMEFNPRSMLWNVFWHWR